MVCFATPILLALCPGFTPALETRHAIEPSFCRVFGASKLGMFATPGFLFGTPKGISLGLTFTIIALGLHRTAAPSMVTAPGLLGVGPAFLPVGKTCIAVIGIAGATSLEVLAAEALLALRPALPPVTIPSMTIIGHSSRRWGGHNATHMELCAAEGLLGNRPSVMPEMNSGITIEGKSRHVVVRTAHLVVLTAPKLLSQRPNFQRLFVAVVWKEEDCRRPLCVGSTSPKYF